MSDVTFEVGFATDPPDDPGTWTDLSDRLEQPVTTGPGVASVVLDNADHALDPTSTSALSGLAPMRPARLTVDVNGTPTSLWRGFVDALPPQWVTGYSTMQLVDAFAWIGLQDSDVDLPQQTTGARIGALLDLASWPAGKRDIDAGVVTLDAFERAGSNLLRVMQDTADAEEGDLYVDPDGVVVFRSRHHQLAQTSQATFGDGGIPLAEDIEPQWDSHRLTNYVATEMEDGTTYVISDSASITSYGKRADSIRDLPVPWYEAVGLADWAVHRFAEPNLWLSACTVAPEDDTQLGTVLALRVGDLVTFNVVVRGETITRQGRIEAISHTAVTGQWLTTFELAPYFGEGPWLEWKDDVASTGETWLSDVATSGGLWAP